MERTECMNKVKCMLPDIQAELFSRCENYYDSGEINTNRYEDDYLLPKVLLTAAFHNMNKEFLPPSDSFKEEHNDIETLKD